MRVVLLLAATTLAVSACTTAQGVTGPATPVPTASASGALGSSTASSPAAGSTPPPASPPASPLATPAPVPPSPSPRPSGSASSVVDPAAIGDPAPVGALVLGDSISLSIAQELSAYGYPVIGLVGQSASGSYLGMHLSTPLAQSARTWVIVLGTNNSGSPDDVARLEGLVDLIDGLRTPGARQQVRWVTPHRPEAYVGGRTAYTLDAFNAELSRLAAERRWLRILDFDALAKANPDWFDADTAMHLHPDQRGQDALVALITGPAPVTVANPAPVLDGAPIVEVDAPEPEVFVNSDPPAAPQPADPASPTPGPPAPGPPAPAASPDPSSPDMGEPAPVPATAEPSAAAG